MQQVIGVTELQRRFRAVFDEVTKKRISIVLTRGSRPQAVLIPYEDYLKYQAGDKAEEQKRFERLMARMQARNEKFSDAEIEADIEAAIQETRAEKRAKSSQSNSR